MPSRSASGRWSRRQPRRGIVGVSHVERSPFLQNVGLTSVVGLTKLGFPPDIRQNVGLTLTILSKLASHFFKNAQKLPKKRVG